MNIYPLASGRIGMSDAAFFIFVLLCLLLFVGDPDLHDVLIDYVDNKAWSVCDE